MSATKGTESSQPMEFRTFSKALKYAEKSNFDGNFGGDTFTIKSWLRRNSAWSDPHEKEHVFCGTDTESQNRHHYGLYFYRKNIKFLLRKEHQEPTAGVSDQFYSSLWEWSVESLDNDGKWHLYEIQVNYPNVDLYIDGSKYEANVTNSDIIDAHEFDNVPDAGARVTYIGACYHARTKVLTEFFEGMLMPRMIKALKHYFESHSPFCVNGLHSHTKLVDQLTFLIRT
jgi:hypothetical protein